MEIYIVMHTTWNGSTIERVFADKDVAKKFADEKERNKGRGDGYIEYYVHTWQVE